MHEINFVQIPFLYEFCTIFYFVEHFLALFSVQDKDIKSFICSAILVLRNHSHISCSEFRISNARIDLLRACKFDAIFCNIASFTSPSLASCPIASVLWEKHVCDAKVHNSTEKKFELLIKAVERLQGVSRKNLDALRTVRRLHLFAYQNTYRSDTWQNKDWDAGFHCFNCVFTPMALKGVICILFLSTETILLPRFPLPNINIQLQFS